MIVDTLKVFVTVIEFNHFSRAAEFLHLSQPAVSSHIRNLEAEFGTKLIHRSPKGMKITEAGEILYQRAKKIISLYDEAKQEIHLLSNTVMGSLKVGASFTIGEYILPRQLAEFSGEYPQVEISVHIANTEEVCQAVRTKKLDIGLIEGKATHSDLVIEPYMEDEMILIAPPDHPLARQRSIDPETLQNQIWILRENGSGTRAYSEQLIRDYGLNVKRSFIFSSSQGIKEAVSAGLGIAMLSRLIVDKEIRASELVELPIKGQKFIRNFSIVQSIQPTNSMALEVFKQKIKG